MLFEEGYYVHGTYNTGGKEAAELKKVLKRIEIFHIDLADRESVKQLLQTLKGETFYAIINNAGIIDFETWDKLTLDLWDKTLEVTLTAPLIISHSLKDNIEKGGRIVNIASTDGMTGSVSSIAYSVSKAGLLNLTKSLTNVFSTKGIRVNSVTPGWVGDGMDSPAIEEARKMNPLGRTARYGEIASVVSFVLSKDASFINGANIVVDGGTDAVDYVLKREDELARGER